MAKETIVRLVSDLSGDVIGDDEGGTVRFALDGSTYEVDLTRAERDEFHAALAPYIAAGRSVARGLGGASRSARTPAAGRGPEELAAIRAWLREQGHEVADRGRIRADLVALYDARD